MSQINLKSISGITSITTPAGVDNQLTVHTNDTTEKLKVTQSGIDVTGVVTATSADINGDLDVDGHTNLDNVSIAGVVTATSFVGDGSGLTGAGPTLTNGADNRVITASSASAIQGEANMTFDGSTLTLTPGSSAGDVTSLVLGRTSSAPAAQTTAVVTGGIPVSGVPGIFFGSTNTNLPAIGFQTPNSSNGHIVFKPKGTEMVRIDSSGRLLLGTTTEGESTADNLTIADSGNCGITIRSGTGNEGNIFFSDGTSGQAEYRGTIQYNQNDDRFVFFTAGTERMRIDSTGALSFTAGNNGQIIHSFRNNSNADQMVITSDGDVAIGRDTALNNYAAGSTTTQLAVVKDGGAAGSGYHEVAHFTGGNDSNDTGAIVRITQFNNDRGLYIKGGRGTGDQAKAIFGLRNSSNSDSDVMVFHQGGNVTKPSEVGFHATGSATHTHSSNFVAEFDTEYFDIGGGYNNSNYRFTAPVAGRYFFYYSKH